MINPKMFDTAVLIVKIYVVVITLIAGYLAYKVFAG